MAEPVEFIAKSRFSFKALFSVLALLVVLEVIQQHYFQGSIAGKNAGNVLLVGISISYFFYRYNRLKVIITPQQVSYGYRKSKMQVIARAGCRFEFDRTEGARSITAIVSDGTRHEIPLRGFDKQQKYNIINGLQ